MTPSSVSAAALRSELGDPNPPILLDVRPRHAFIASDEAISGALRREPDDARSWANALPKASSVVAYCADGGQPSPAIAAGLNEAGIAARYLEGGLRAWKADGAPVDRKPRDASTRWVTRERPKIDRIACPWLVARFVDPDAEFLYVPRERVLDEAKARDAVPYDVPDVRFSHQGERCSFDAFLEHYRLSDPALEDLARIVRGADTGRLELAPQAAGLAAISLGLSRNFRDDHEMLKHGVVMYDALYTWCKEGKEEGRTWNPSACR